MTAFPTRDEVVAHCSAAIGMALIAGDEGLLQAAVARPRATVFGVDAYPTVWDKAAALLHSLACNHYCHPQTEACRVDGGVAVAGYEWLPSA